MASLRDIRRRIRSVVSIKQITRAMEMVATTKLRRFQERAVASRPFTNEIEGLVKRLVKASGEGYRPFIVPPGTDPTEGEGAKKGVLGILIVTSDRGLCGAYNGNIFSLVVKYLRENDLWRPGMPPTEFTSRVRLYVVGRKGFTFLSRRGIEVERFFAEPPLEKMKYIDIRLIGKILVDDFRSDKLSKILVASTRFESMVTFKATMQQWLPVSSDQLTGIETERDDSDVILEPSADALVRRLVPKFLERKLWNLLLESLTSEYASRRVSMKNATDSAEEMRGNLLRTYNRVRQESITKQLLEIVGGAEAIK